MVAKQILKFGKLDLKVSFKLIQAFGISIESTKPLGCCMVKPHGQLVQVSSMPRSTYTPCLSTS